MIQDLLQPLLDCLAANRPVAYCRLVETRGSTPQKAGAAMLVFADGSQAGTLGGGCVEAEVKRRSLKILETGSAEIVDFQLDSDYGWDDGLICGGKMQVLVDPLRPGDNVRYFETLQTQIDHGTACMEVIAFDAVKSGVPTPACWLVDAQGVALARRLQATSELPVTVREHSPTLSDRPRASAAHGVAYLPQLERCRLIIVGGGHIGHAVGQLATDLDFKVWIVDDRPEYVSTERFPRRAINLRRDWNRLA